uniref:RoaA n=1 Tax=Phacus orbicularis TaxID=158829 RepID=A0A172F1X7_9EUGL|nr:RoaA [Phacus orbicularis]
MSNESNFRQVQLRYRTSITNFFARVKVVKYILLEKRVFYLKKEVSFMYFFLVFLLSKNLILSGRFLKLEFLSKNLKSYLANINIFNISYQYINNLFLLPILESISYRLSFGFRPYRNCFDFFTFVKKEIKIHSFLSGIEFLGWYFLNLRSKVYISLISYDNILAYKLRLKFLIKKISLHNFFRGLELLNKEIYLWTSSYGACDNFRFLCKRLDFYVYVLLWKFLKKRHPRRPNTWIYAKYWRSLEGFWYFTVYDFVKKRFFILQKHFSSFTKIYTLPYSFEIYNFIFYRRMINIWFKKINHFNNDIYFILWKTQFGLCFYCKNLFEKFEITSIKFVIKKYFKRNFWGSNYLLNFCLVHNFCI